MSDTGTPTGIDPVARSLLRIGERLGSTLDVEQVMQVLSQETSQLIGTRGAVAGLYDGSALDCQCYWSLGLPLPLQRRWVTGQGLPGWLIAHRQPYLAPDTGSDPQAERDFYRQLGVTAALAVPVLDGPDELLGFVELHDKLDGSGFTDADHDLLQGVARLAAVAIRNARAFQQLHRAEEQREQADRKRNEFLATLAHELRNPLAPIRHALQIMQLAGNKPQLIETTRAVIERQVQQLVRLVEDLLDVSRVSTGRVALRREWVDLASTVHDAVETVRPLLVQRGHRLRVSLPPEPIYLDGDPVRLAQIFTNLLNNACKFTPVGGRISLTAQPEAGKVCVTIADSGRGITAEALQRVFDPFTRIDRLLDRTEGGLGVGLSLARTLAELHGGGIVAASRGPDQGAEFIVTLPLSTTQPHPGALAQREASPAPAGQRVLLVDDNPDTVSTLASLLAMMGHEVKTASGGLEALEAGPDFHPDVVLLDIGMPGMDGYETARRVRGTSWGREAALVAATGWGQEEDKQRALKAGFNAHMTKPIDPQALERLLGGLDARTSADLLPATDRRLR
ncbi:hybrid sensor histidine kinase/response regulator [Eleftheria terrae]|uniref:hybrid sensor histidine kinase/response regulator n=1 Tax=Eleftheria terrae TaxID=1597781 RepID=UPI00263BCCEF|nr:ATP-binding protein [Eleftheria terrae]WKB52907.1 ATP-binding protein [Eleftheria terrae]